MNYYLNKAKILFFDGLNETYKFILDKHNQAKQVLTPSSPYIQIITVLHNIQQTIMLYFSDSILENNIYKARKIQSIQGLSRLSGHNPTRANCSKGELQIKIKINAVQNIPGSYLTLNEGLTLQSKRNNLTYTCMFNQERIIINKTDFSYFLVNIVQGEFNEQQFISDGTEIQSFNLQGAKSVFIDDQYVFVYVNGVLQPKHEFYYDMPPNEDACQVLTGISGGIDIYFGNGTFGKIPPEGSIIKVVYLETSGRAGNIYNNLNEVSFTWDDTVTDNLGNEIDLNEVLDTRLNGEVIFGTNPEPTKFTQVIAPQASRTNILGNTDSYIYYFKKMNLFSYVDAYTTFDDDFLEDDHIIYLFLIPDIQRKLEETNYFNIPTTSFLLSSLEKEKILNNIRKSRKQIPASEVKIVEPKITRYVLNIALRVFEGYDETTLYNDVITMTSNYFLNIRRRDRIPRSDLTRIIEKISFVDSVYLEFLSANNEIAKAKGFYINEIIGSDGIRELRVEVPAGTDPNLGLDEFGDIVINNGELPVIRGNFYDANNNFYEEFYVKDKLGAINIFIKQVIPRDSFAIILNEKLDKI